MTIGPASPFFIVDDLAASVAFYRDVLGWDVRFQTPDGAPFFAIVGRGAAQIFLKEVGGTVVPTPNRSHHTDAPWDAFIFAEDPDTEAARIKASPAQRDDGLYGFEVTDQDGYVLYFGRPTAP